MGLDHVNFMPFAPQIFNKDKMKDFAGTLSYAAPEVIKCIHGRAKNCGYTSQCDMWSLGVLAIVLLTNEMPFNGNDELQMRQIQQGSHIMKPDLWGCISSECKDFVRSCLQNDPSKRSNAQQALYECAIWTTQD